MPASFFVSEILSLDCNSEEDMDFIKEHSDLCSCLKKFKLVLEICEHFVYLMYSRGPITRGMGNPHINMTVFQK